MDVQSMGGAGPEPSGNDLTGTVYSHLRAIAQNKLAQERPGHTLQATALVHEAYMRLERGGLGGGVAGAAAAADGGGRSRFYWAAAEAMRRILIEHARAKKAEKRGGGRRREDWTDGIAEGMRIDSKDGIEAADFESLDEAIVRLSEKDPRAADVIRLRFYAGLSVEQAAEALGITSRTAKRDWEYARAWLHREMGCAGEETAQ